MSKEAESVARPKVLFVCTGNYYRSRFSERLFIARAHAGGLDWEADSAGLFESQNPNNVGFMSKFALQRLEALGISSGDPNRKPRGIVLSDLERACRVVIMDETEHRAPFGARFPDWLDRVDFWQVPDIDRMESGRALDLMEAHVGRLVSALVELQYGEAGQGSLGPSF